MAKFNHLTLGKHLETRRAGRGRTSEDKRMLRRLYELWLEWKYRNVDPELCCCGDTIGQGGSICYHGGCRSAKEYAITSRLEDVFGK